MSDKTLPAETAQGRGIDTMMDVLRYFYRAWKYRLRNEPTEIRYLVDHVPRGGVAVDVGAHKGAYLYWLRKKVGPQGRVFAFEPQPSLAAYLKEMVSQLGWENVIVENKGVSSQRGILPLHVPENESGASPSASLCAHASGESTTTLDVDVVSLDDYFQEQGIEQIDFLKCDVEGHEQAVFEGATRLLSSGLPTLLFECEGRHHLDGHIASVLDYLNRLGFEGSFFLQGDQLPVSEFQESRHQAREGERFWESPGYCANFAYTKRKAA